MTESDSKRMVEQRLIEQKDDLINRPLHDSENDVDIDQVRAYFASHDLGIKPEDVTALGTNKGRDIYPITIAGMTACDKMVDNHSHWVSRGYNNMLHVSPENGMRIRYVC